MTGADRWAQVPSPPPVADHELRARVGLVVAALVIGPFGPTVRTLGIAPAPAPVVVGLVGVSALAAIWRWRSAPWWARLAIVLAAGTAAAPFGGLAVGLWLAASTALAGWVATDRLPVPDGLVPGPGHEAMLPATVLALVATWRGWEVTATVAPLVVVALAFVVTALTARFPGLAARVAVRVSRTVEPVVQAVLLTPLWLVAVLVPWLVQRLFRLDPLRAPVGPDAMVRIVPRRAEPSRLWVPTGAIDPLPRGERVRRRLVVPALVLALVAGFAYVRLLAPTPTEPVPAAVADAPWWPEWRRTMDWYAVEGLSPLRHQRPLDIRSPSVNVAGGERATWRAPACDCERIQLWMYGGSTTFGYGQRDDHTIASELARLAWADGFALDVANRGVPGDGLWLESERFAWDVAAADPPDVAIFYDGVNDIAAGERMNAAGHGLDEEPPTDLLLDDLRQDVEGQRHLLALGNGTRKPSTVAVVPDEPGPVLGVRRLGRAIAARYERSRSLSAATAEQADVPVRWYWQPSLASRVPVDGEPEQDPHNVAVVAAATRALPDEVVDLSDVLDAPDEPIYLDSTHTNEQGARLVAEAIYRDLRPTLRQLRADAGGGS